MRVGDDAADSACEICSDSAADGRDGTDRSTQNASRRFLVGPNPGGAPADAGQGPALGQALEVVALDDEPHRARRGRRPARRRRPGARTWAASSAATGTGRASGFQAESAPVPVNAEQREPAVGALQRARWPCRWSCRGRARRRRTPTSPSIATTGTSEPGALQRRQHLGVRRRVALPGGQRRHQLRGGRPVVAGEPGVRDHARVGGVGLEHAPIVVRRRGGAESKRAVTWRVGRWGRGRRSLGGTHTQPDGGRWHLDLVRLPQAAGSAPGCGRWAFTLLPLAAYLTKTLQLFTGDRHRDRRLGRAPGLQPGRVGGRRAGRRRRSS